MQGSRRGRGRWCRGGRLSDDGWEELVRRLRIFLPSVYRYPQHLKEKTYKAIIHPKMEYYLGSTS